MGQCIVFLVPITPEATIPAGSMPDMPDPGVTKRNKSEEQNKKSGKNLCSSGVFPDKASDIF